MPLTKFQEIVLRILSVNRTPESYLAGAAALHLEPNTKRFSNDLDFFNDSEERVADSYREDSQLLAERGYAIRVEMNQPGYIPKLK